MSVGPSNIRISDGLFFSPTDLGGVSPTISEARSHSFKVMLCPDSLCLYGVRMSIAQTEEGEAQIPQLLADPGNGRVAEEQYVLKAISDISHVVRRLTPFLGLRRTWVCIPGKYLQSRYFTEEIVRALSKANIDPRVLGFEFNACDFKRFEYITPEILQKFQYRGYGISISISVASEMELLAEVRARFDYLRMRSTSLMASLQSSAGSSLKGPTNTIVPGSRSEIVLSDVVDPINYNQLFGLTVSAVERRDFPQINCFDRFIKFLGQPEYSISRIRAESL